MVNEDTQGNVRQLQAEVRKLKEQLANALSHGRIVELTPTDSQSGTDMFNPQYTQNTKVQTVLLS